MVSIYGQRHWEAADSARDEGRVRSSWTGREKPPSREGDERLNKLKLIIKQAPLENHAPNIHSNQKTLLAAALASDALIRRSSSSLVPPTTTTTAKTANMLHYDFPLVPFLFATALSVNGLRKRSLSPSGAAAAFLTGIAMLSLPLRTPGISLIVFYLLGSRATKAGRQKKATLEDGHDLVGAGYRTAAQVISNSASALIATLIWGALHAPGFPGARPTAIILEVEPAVYHHDVWCPLDRGVSAGWSRALLFVVLGSVPFFSLSFHIATRPVSPLRTRTLDVCGSSLVLLAWPHATVFENVARQNL
jgi:hypothetical protein